MHCVLSLGLGRKKFAECSLRLLLILHNIYATGEGDLGVFWGLFLIDRDAGHPAQGSAGPPEPSAPTDCVMRQG